MVAMPLILSLSIAKMGERARPSSLLNSLELVTKIFRTFRKYHMSGGKASRMNGNAVTAVIKAPTTKKAHMLKSNSVAGSKSSLLPTSAENLFKILENTEVMKNNKEEVRYWEEVHKFQ